MTQILVTGMHRSGTTLCFDLLRRHPECVNAVNEVVLLDRSSLELMEPPFYSNHIDSSARRPTARPGKKTPIVFRSDPHECQWVAKMSYPGPVILQEWCRPAADYVGAWLDEFEKNARIIHMVRHPFAVFDSVRRRWGGDPVHLNNYGAINPDSVCRDWASAVGTIEQRYAIDPRFLTVLYEDLVTEPETALDRILEHCALASNTDLVQKILSDDVVFFGKVDASRANAHREANIETISRSTSWMLTPLFEKWGYSDR